MLRTTAGAPEISTPAMSSIPFLLANALCMSTTTMADFARSISTGSGLASSFNIHEVEPIVSMGGFDGVRATDSVPVKSLTPQGRVRIGRAELQLVDVYPND